jgi:hypothetical protein
MEWRPATATWYGDAEGDGSTGKKLPLASIVAVDSSLHSISSYPLLRRAELS